MSQCLLYISKCLFILILVAHCSAKEAQQCIFPIDSAGNYLNRWPLVFNTRGELLNTSRATEKLVIPIESNDNVIVSCSPNFIRSQHIATSLEVQCDGSTGKFIVAKNGKIQNADDLTCDLRVIEEIVDKVSHCNDAKWTASKYGYVHPIEQRAYIIGEACYDELAGRTIFAHVKLGVEYLEQLEPTKLSRGRHPNVRYKTDLFRGLSFDEIYKRLNDATGKSPMFDMERFIDEPLLGSWQYQEVKKLGWNYFVAHEDLQVLHKLKKDIANLAKQTSLDVYIGSHDVFKLKALDGGNFELYLQEPKAKRFPVPAYLWLLVRNAQGELTGFLIKNSEPKPDADTLCQSVCDKLTWLHESKSAAASMQCCSYDELRAIIIEAPEFSKVNGLLV